MERIRLGVVTIKHRDLDELIDIATRYQERGWKTSRGIRHSVLTWKWCVKLRRSTRTERWEAREWKCLCEYYGVPVK